MQVGIGLQVVDDDTDCSGLVPIDTEAVRLVGVVVGEELGDVLGLLVGVDLAREHVLRGPSRTGNHRLAGCDTIALGSATLGGSRTMGPEWIWVLVVIVILVAVLMAVLRLARRR